MAAAGPYETARALFADLPGWSLSDPLLHEVVGECRHGLTGRAVRPTADELRQRGAQVAPGRTWRPLLVWAVDGADGPRRLETAKGRRHGRKRTRAQQARWTGPWQAAKGWPVSLGDGERIVPRVRWQQGQRDAELAEALRHVHAAGRIPAASVRCGRASGQCGDDTVS